MACQYHEEMVRSQYAVADVVDAGPFDAFAFAPVADEPPPISQEAALAPPAPLPPSQHERFLRGLHNSRIRAGASNVLGVHAIVDSVSVVERSLPSLVSWGEDGNFATKVTLSIRGTYCGTSPSTTELDVWHAGRVLADGRGFRTSQTMTDFAPGEDGFFWLERLGGEWRLTAGRDSSLAADGNGTFSDHAGVIASIEELEEVCI